jgi:lysophospholipase L1-like esterase
LNYQNIIVFGDSLSDIGTKWRQPMGRFAKKANLMTVNPNGRFSDCRNWADYMYEAATGGQTLVTGGAEQTIAASTPHKRFSANSGWMSKGKGFRYANYAEGGACAGTPKSLGNKIGLGTFKDQVSRFRIDAPTINIQGETFLIFVWFGANDLYTDGQKPCDMPGAANKIMKRRGEILQILSNAGVRTTGGAVRFVFMGMGLPTSAARYQNKLDRALQRVRDNEIHMSRYNIKRLWKSKEQIVKELFNARIEALNMLAAGAILFNDRLQDLTNSPDIFVDMQQALSPESVASMMGHYGLIEGVQPKEWSNMHLSAKDYDEIMSDVAVPISTSDEAHPSDRVYKYMWASAIAPQLRASNVTFGNFA